MRARRCLHATIRWVKHSCGYSESELRVEFSSQIDFAHSRFRWPQRRCFRLNCNPYLSIGVAPGISMTTRCCCDVEE